MSNARYPRRGARWLLIAVAAVFVLALGAVGAVYVSLAGGLDDVMPRSRPTERSAKVVRARAAAEPAVVSRLTAMVEGPVRAAVGAAAPVGPPPPSVETINQCERGTHNWKIDDPYDLRCTLKATAIVTASQEGFRDQMLRLHEGLVAAGWQAVPHDGGIPEAVTEYWDSFNGPFPNSPTQDDAYTPADLPSERYGRADDPAARLEIDWTDRSDRHEPRAASIAERDYGIVLTLEHRYFEQ